MKNMKKILALVLAALLVAGMMSVAFAADDYSITVDVNFDGQQYELYKLFNATTNAARQSATDTDSNTEVTADGIAYTLIDETDHALTKEFNVTKADGTSATVKGTDWFKFVNDSSKNITVKDSSVDITTELFRLWAKAYGVKTGSTLTAGQDNDPAIKWTGLENGYYFISTTTGTLVTVTSIAPNAIVKDKNSVPSIDKTVQEDSLVTGEGAYDGDGVTAYQKQNDQEIGKTVYFKTVVAAKKGAIGYVVYDKLSQGLTFDGISSITVYKGSVAAANVVAAENYTAKLTDKYYNTTTGTTLTTGETAFSVTFTQAFLDTITADTDLIITYTAKVNSDAVINTPIPNDTILKYGNDTYSEESTTHTYVWGIDVLKVDAANTTTKLAGAKFVIYKVEGGKNYFAKFDSNNKLSGWTEADETAVADLVKKEESFFTNLNATVLTTNNNGQIVVTGIDEGAYKILEVSAPAGYNKLDAPVDVTVDSTSDTAAATTLQNAISAGNYGSVNATIGNNSGSTLPSTGGIGTTLFYVGGGILVLAAVILLVTKRRMSSND